MAFNIPEPEQLDEGSVKQALEAEVVKGLGVDENLIALAEGDETKDGFEAKLMQIRPQNWQEFFKENGVIDREALAAKLTTREKFAILAGHFLGDQIFSLFFSGTKDNVKTLSMEDAADYFARNPDKGARKMGKHLVWDQNSIFAQAKTLFSLADLAKDKSDENNEAFPLVPGTFWFVNFAPPEGGPKLKPTMYSVMKRACEQVGVKLSFLRPGERPLEKPQDKEITMSFLTPKSIPLKTDGTVDLDLLDWYTEAYDMAPWMIMQGNPLLAAILKRKGMATTDALSEENANMKGQGMEAVLDSIPTQGTPPPEASKP